ARVTFLPAIPMPGDIRAGSVRGSPGFFRVAQAEGTGAWWFIDPAGRHFYAAAVAFPEVAPVSPSRLRSWGFNTVVVDAPLPEAAASGFAWLPSVDFCAAGSLINVGGARIPDVFDPA